MLSSALIISVFIFKFKLSLLYEPLIIVVPALINVISPDSSPVIVSVISSKVSSCFTNLFLFR